MTDEDPLIASLRRAVEAMPQDLALRVHLGEQLLGAGDAGGAIEQAAAALAQDPGCVPAQTLMKRALTPAGEPPRPDTSPGSRETPPADAAVPPGAPASPPTARSAREPGPADGFDWKQAEDQLSDAPPPPYLPSQAENAPVDEEPGAADPEVEHSAVTLRDVGGMAAVKERLEAAFLAPMRNPELRKLFGKSMRGGLLMYGPPGCGKTFIARAVAGELGARFISVSLTDILDMWLGNSEKNVHSIFEAARRNQPCVLFLDEVDAIGLKRTRQTGSGMRGAMNQLLAELDPATESNDGVFVLAASNQPWDIDGALLRPGRLDRTILVLPPDAPARAAIITYHLSGRPIAGIDLDELVARTDGMSGADLAHLCDTAAERVILEAGRTGVVRMIEMRDFVTALGEVRASTGPWFESARNVVRFANQSGRYDDLRAYMRQRKLL